MKPQQVKPEIPQFEFESAPLNSSVIFSNYRERFRLFTYIRPEIFTKLLFVLFDCEIINKNCEIVTTLHKIHILTFVS